MATFSTVTSTRSGGTVATTSSGLRVVPSSIRSTRSSVGGTTGRPSVQPRVNIASMSSSSSASSTRRERSRPPSKRTRSSSTRSGSTLIEPQPGRMTGRSSPSPSRPVIRCQSARDQPTVRSTSTPSTTRISVGTVSMAWCQLTARSSSWSAVDAGRERRVVLRVHGEVELAGQVGEQRGDHAARLALLLDDDDQPVGQGRGVHVAHHRPSRRGTRHTSPRRAFTLRSQAA